MQKMYPYLFLVSPLMALTLWMGYARGFFWFPIALFFVVTPILDALIGSKPIHLAPEAQKTLATHPVLRVIPLINAAAWFVTLGFAIYVAPQVLTHGPLALALWAVGLGIVGGALCITTAHELIHRNNQVLRNLGGIMMASTCYGVFKIEHVRGHHLNVATNADPVSSRKGESVYPFLPRAIIGTFTHAFKIESDWLAKRGHGFWSLRNECLWLSAASVVMGLAAWALSGWAGLALFLGSSLVAIVLLEIIDYIEHYGLSRAPGERVGPQHSWDHDAFVTNFFLINLERHADHHAHGGKAFGSLVNYDNVPKLPMSYGAMVMMALVPPLFMGVMDKRLPPVTR
jgi:alkane 1-monooxygenase